METTRILPIIPLDGLLILPGITSTFDMVMPSALQTLNYAVKNRLQVFFSALEEGSTDSEKGDMYAVGVIASVLNVTAVNKHLSKVTVHGEQRAEFVEFYEKKSHITGVVKPIEEEPESRTLVDTAFLRTLQNTYEKYIKATHALPDGHSIIQFPAQSTHNFIYEITASLKCELQIKQRILEITDLHEQLEELISVLHTEIQLAELSRGIADKARQELSERQREYFLREEMRIIGQELGDDEGAALAAEYRDELDTLGLAPEYVKKLLRDIGRLESIGSSSPDFTVLSNYLRTVFTLPWTEETEENTDLKNAEEILNNDHYGLERVKERILEHLSVRALTGGKTGNILCLVGPPGTGKTSIARSVAAALNRKYSRIALGGISDEAEIRGHRKTYIGAMEGRIISAVSRAGTKNPLILLDELDKLGQDYKGDPSAALLEVLDPEQNSAFTDSFIEIPFDLSDVFFIATANSLSTIPKPLLDRVEVIEISGYTAEEKFEIARQYLVPKQIKKCGLKGRRITITDDAIYEIINYYTRESGVRGLERTIAALLRKAAREILTEGKKSLRISAKRLSGYIGGRKYRFDTADTADRVGTVCGLAWTSVGGETLSVEVNVMPGSGKVELTGNLGDVMKESALTAVSYVRSQADNFHIENDFYKTKDIHIHVPEGAVPKDGPSAGITIATAITSALTNKPVKSDVAMTGEITLRGRVLPIGGLKEKTLAAHRAGIKTVIIPCENESDLEDIPQSVREEITFVTAESMDTVLKASVRNICP